ncbi:MAG TPA: hypothetical protein VEK79_03650 [Thermoanaerobaculia bacterium]|nr:hypothetical protein [Thermoanaerobaculia bacterium]
MTSYYLWSAVPALIVIGGALLAARAAWNRRRKEKETFRSIARTFGFTFSEPPNSSNFMTVIGDWEMKGTYNRIPVRIYGKRVSGQKNNSESTFVDATANCQTKCQLAITRETTLSRIGGAAFGLQDIATGDADLDRRVVVKGVPIHIVERIARNPKFQRELARLFELDGMIHVDLHGAHYRRSTVFTNEQSLRLLLEAMTRTAAALEEAAA